jgi:hypothetical protein
MNSNETRTIEQLTARVPADLEAPDRVLGDLTARQVAVLAVAAAFGYLTWQAAHTRVPTVVLLVAAVPWAGAAIVLAVGRRDGLPLEAWLAHAVRYRRAPRRQVPTRSHALPAWAPDTPPAPAPGVLQLPVDAIDADGVIHLTGRSTTRAGAVVCLVGVSTLPLAARAPQEQAGLVAGFAAWLNGLTTPVQIVISQRRVDLTGHALRIADTIHLAGDPALAAAGLDHAEFLLDLAADTDPLARTLTIATTGTPTGPSTRARADREVAALRAGDHTAQGLCALGATAVVLDAGAVTAALTTAVDPYQPGDAGWRRAAPTTPITTRHDPDEEDTE